MITRCKIGKGITGAVRYILGEGRDPDSGELNALADGEETRVDWFGGVGFGFEIVSRDDADLARRIMEFDAQNQASRTRRCEMDCVHLSLCWRPGEQPTREQMAATAQGALAAMGTAPRSPLCSPVYKVASSSVRWRDDLTNRPHEGEQFAGDGRHHNLNRLSLGGKFTVPLRQSKLTFPCDLTNSG
jgi:hypothetical protein